MTKNILLLLLLITAMGYAQQPNPDYDEAKAKALNADEHGMKTYVFCLLKTGSFTTSTQEERVKLFEGHMANINKLSKEGKLVVAGPFMKNDRNYRGIFIFNVSTIEEAQAIVDSDPAVKAKLFEAELTLWYSTAALQEITKLHDKIAKSKF
ncbi:YciI family protein [Flavobacterium sp.]|uniref:YciI family protein n=1 Tax=Flavobacterium sp. TaxID=239 RepID=UPI002FD88AE6